MVIFSAQNFVFHNQSINLKVEKGEIVLVLGGNSSGKTTLGKLISRCSPCPGLRWHPQITPDDIAMVEYSAENRHFHYNDYFYQQRYHSFEIEDLPAVKTILGIKSAKHQQLFSSIFNYDILEKNIMQLSSGETRKMQILHQLLQEKQLYILDQPFVGLDEGSTGLFENLFIELVSEGKTIIVFGTDQGELKKYHRKFQLEGRQSKFQTSNFQAPELAKPKFRNFAQICNARLFAGDFLLINDLNWDIKKGDKYLLKGPNGSGKSTLSSLLYADHPAAYALKLYLFDRRRGTGESIWEIKDKIGFISPEMQRHFSARATVRNILLSAYSNTLYLNRQISQEEEKGYEEMIEKFQIRELEVRLFSSLSTGEKTLVILARCLLKNPPVLILDEPFQGLDRYYFTFLYQLLSKYLQPDRTILQIAHRSHEILPGVEKTAEIRDRKLIVSD